MKFVSQGESEGKEEGEGEESKDGEDEPEEEEEEEEMVDPKETLEEGQSYRHIPIMFKLGTGVVCKL